MPSAVIVGASRGIGRALVDHYVAAGWTVAATARTPAQAEALTAAGAHGVVADVTDAASLAALAAAAPGPHDLLVLNAGANVMEGKLADVDPAAWSRIMATNALGPLLALQALAATVRAGGKIVALSSTLGSIGANAGGGLWSYRMSKAALNAGMKNLAIELKPRDIAVAMLHPGWVKTDMGGPQAEVEIVDSVRGLAHVIDALDIAHTGSFTDYRGNALPW